MPQLREKITMYLICTLAYKEHEAKIFEVIPTPVTVVLCCVSLGDTSVIP